MTRILLYWRHCVALAAPALAEKPEPDPKRIVNDLKQIVLAYHVYGDANKGKSPASPPTSARTSRWTSVCSA